MKTVRLLALLMLAGAPVAAQPIDATVFSLVGLDATARGAALAGAVSGTPSDDAASVFYNPALVHDGTRDRISLTYLNHVSELKTGVIAYARDVAAIGTVVGGLRFLGWGELTGADADGVETGTFRATEFVATLGASRALNPRLRYGASFNLLGSRIDGNGATAMTLDGGLFYHVPEKRLGLSASVHHLGLVLSSIGEAGDDLPIDVRLGISKRLTHLPLLLNVTAYDLADPSGGNVLYHLRFGGEFQFSDAFQVRFGYDHRRHEALKVKSRLDFAGVGFGFGLRVRRIDVDYAFNSWSSLGGLHRFTIGTRL